MGRDSAEERTALYRRIADDLAAKIRSGQIAAGERLPTHRELARKLGVNVTTVTRAFACLQREGLVEGRPGRGTMVCDPRARETAFQTAPSDDNSLVDLAVNRPPTAAYLDELAMLLPRLPRDRRFRSLQDYHPPEGPQWAREAAAGWLSNFVSGAEDSRLFIANGAQHALACIIAGVTRPGEVMLAEQITYQGIAALARSHGLDLKGIAADRDGMRPDAFEAACDEARPRAVFLVPNLQNPTTVTMPAARRKEIARIARAYNVLILEDDVYAPLLDARPAAFADLEPDLTIHVTGLSKCVAPGMRVGFVLAPRALAANIATAFRIDCWSAVPANALTATILIEGGGLERIVRRQKEELRARQAIAVEILEGFDLRAQDTATHVWLYLPEPWRSTAFSQACRRRGLSILPAEPFTVGQAGTVQAVRVNVGAARSREDLRQGLSILRAVAETEDPHALASI